VATHGQSMRDSARFNKARQKNVPLEARPFAAASSQVIWLVAMAASLLWRNSVFAPALSSSKPAFALALSMTPVRRASSFPTSTILKMSPLSGNGSVQPSTTNLMNTHYLAETLIQAVNSTNAAVAGVRATLVTAGGGSSAISAMASTPGASRVLLEGRVLYDKRSFVDFIVNHSTKSPSLAAQQQIPIEQDSLRHGSFCSPDAAVALARGALHRSFKLTPRMSTSVTSNIEAQHDGMSTCIGIGCTSVLVSNRPHRGQERCHLAVMEASGTAHTYTCYLSRREEDKTKDSSIPPRTRLAEEELVSNILLYSMLEHYQQQEEASPGQNSDLKQAIDQCQTSMLHPDEALETSVIPSPFTADETESSGTTSYLDSAARQVTEGKLKCVLLTPTRRPCENTTTSTTTLTPLAHTVLPVDCLIVPGSFNPPHVGHMTLARAAVRAIRRKRQSELEQRNAKLASSPFCIEDKIQHSLARDDVASPPVIFEMSVTNADKPPMEVNEVVKRLNYFCSLDVEVSNDSQEENDWESIDWGVVLTAAPLFSQKVDILGDCIASMKANNVNIGECTEKLIYRNLFVIPTLSYPLFSVHSLVRS
jgi:hypothetical protein